MVYRDIYSQPLLYLVRHGFTEENEEGEFRGIEDYPLNDDGLEAAQEIARFLSFRPIGPVASSTILRAVQTAQAITSDFDRDPGLMCLNIGWFSGKSKKKYADKFQWYIDHPDEVIPGGESVSFFRRTVERNINKYLSQGTYQGPIVLVTHSSYLRAAKEHMRPDIFNFESSDLIQPGGIVGVYANDQGSVDFVPLLGERVSEGANS